MKNLFVALAFIVALFVAPVFADEFDEYGAPVGKPAEPEKSVDPENAKIVSQQEFYFYDENKMRTPLFVSRRIAVRFVGEKEKKDDVKAEYLKKYQPVELSPIGGLYPRTEYALGYLPTIELKVVIGLIKKLSADDALDVSPIFMVDGMEAVVDGIYIETTTPMSRDTVLLALKKTFGGDAMIHEVTPEGRLWHVSFKKLFFLGEKKLPLHTLSLANFLTTSERLVWVKRAYPKFVFLTKPVVASIRVSPVSGTVGEERTVILSIRIFGKNETTVKVDETAIPEFMQGKFTVLSGMKPPQAAFFDVRGIQVKTERKQVGPNEWRIERQYWFGLYAPEPEWSISGLEVPYEYAGKRETATVSPVTFFVRPHLDNKYELSDIPSPYLLPTIAFPGIAPYSAKQDARWFDPVKEAVGGYERLSGLLIVLLIGSALTASISLSFPLVRFAQSKRLNKKEFRVWDSAQIETELSSVEHMGGIAEKKSASLHAVVSKLFAQRFPEMPERNVTIQDFKELRSVEKYQSLLAKLEEEVGIEELFEGLEMRHARLFSENSPEVLATQYAELVERVRVLWRLLRASEESEG